LGFTGVPTEKIHKGRIWEDLMGVWRVLGGILPLQKADEKTYKQTYKNIRRS